MHSERCKSEAAKPRTCALSLAVLRFQRCEFIKLADYFCNAFFKARPNEGSERTMVSFGTVKDIRI
jgi:hypothetical protein